MKKIVVLIFCLGVLIRTWYFLYPLGRTTFLSVDESVYGVQSLRILQGEKPVFYPAQVYTGSFSAYLSAILYLIFGFSPVLLKIVPFIFSLVFIYLNYRLALKVSNKKSIAITTLLITSLGTPFWNNWSSRAGTGYVEVSVLGNLLLLLVLNLNSTKDDDKKRVSLKLFLTGFIAGLGLWIQPTMVYYLVPVAIYFIFNCRRYLRRKFICHVPLGFVVGAFPVILYNFLHNSATTRTLFKLPWGMKSGLIKLLTEGMPVLTGVRTSNSTADFFTPFALIIETFVLLAFLYFSTKFAKNLIKIISVKSYFLNPEDLIFLTTVSTIAIFLTSTPFNQFSIEPRYVFSLYSTLPIIVSYFLLFVWNRAKYLLIPIGAVYLANFIFGLYLANPITFNDSYKVEHLTNYLKQHGVSNVISDPALGHRVMYYSKLSVLAAVRGGGLTEWRFPDINEKVTSIRDKDNLSVGFIMLKGSSYAKDFEREISYFTKGRFKNTEVENNFIFFEPIK